MSSGTCFIVCALALSQPAVVGEQLKKTPIGGMAEDSFGSAVAVFGDTAVVGSASAAVGGNADVGVAFVLQRIGANWTQVATLTTTDGITNDFFGYSADIYGDTIVVGAREAGATNAGAAYVFVRPNGGWADMTETAKLTASDAAADNLFGYSVAIFENTIAIGAPESGAMKHGSAYVFEMPNGGWTDMFETAKLTLSDAAIEDLMGFAVAVSSDTVVASVINDGNTGAANFDGTGSLGVFVRSPAGWANQTETARLTASDGSDADFLGYSLDIDGDTIVAGAVNSGNSGSGMQDGSGSAYVFRMPEGGWVDSTQSAKLIYSTPEPTGYFGFSIAIVGGRVLVGAPNRLHTPMMFDGEGLAYLYIEPAGGWSGIIPEFDELPASDALEKRLLGYNVAISEDWMLVGAPGAGPGSLEPGSAYFFAFDNDEDGVSNHADNCPDDPEKLDEGVCGCGVEEIDSDGDGVFDCVDACPADAPNDSDGDGVCDSLDVCPGGDDTIDADGNGTPDDCDEAGPLPAPGECCGGGMPALLPFMLMGLRRRGRKSRELSQR